MGKKYSEEEIIDIVNREVACSQNLYRHTIINYTGKTKDIFYSEIISKRLLELGIEKLMEQSIKKISRTKSYHAHPDTIPIRNTTRLEENFAKKLFNERKKIGFLGRVIECQIPLKDSQEDAVGKIDLVSIDNSGVLYLIELKYGDNQETLLRAALEIATYYHELDKDKLIGDFSNKHKGLSIDRIKKAVLLGKTTQAYYEAMDLTNRPHLNQLIKTLEIQIAGADTFKKL